MWQEDQAWTRQIAREIAREEIALAMEAFKEAEQVANQDVKPEPAPAKEKAPKEK